MKVIDLTGKKFGKLTVISKVENFGKDNYRWLCKCDCGKTKEVLSSHLKSGKIKSCGCLQLETLKKYRVKHNMRHTRIYGIWASIKRRCYNKNEKMYKYYGGRCIKMCDEWKNDFISFYNWAIKNGYNQYAKKGECTIDRIDNNGNYEPSNCRWINQLEQANNKRNNIYYFMNNEKHTISEWCRKYNMPYRIVYKRLKRGWSLEKSLTTPKLK